ncbi:SWIM zinc finger family protein [Streptomyces sp. NPDC057616]|uniref:SWIM zinc finger family protein n=1 Tax=Streptomyces sp. NPDC057616 TaxID=3346183 RepID=UPI003684CB2E
MSPGPADEARRALREAREREGAAQQKPASDAGEATAVPGASEASDARGLTDAPDTPKAPGAPAAPAATGAPDEPDARDEAEPPEPLASPVPPEPRPGDAARAALRRRSASVPPSETPDEKAPEPGEEEHRPGPADPAAARPGDVAREALRAARAESLRAREEAVRPPRRQAADRTRGVPGRRTPGLQARGIRELVADAFRMPDEAAGPDETHEDGAHEDVARRGQGTGPARPPAPAHEPHRPDPDPDPAPTRTSSMAAPGRDGELRRTFPAFPSRTADSVGDTRFAATWWGNAWVTALEEGALDAKRLARGRSYAEQGNVDAITVTPGLVLAYVQGSRPRPYRVQVRLRTLEHADWARFLDTAAERPADIAALLDKELPQSLADCGVPLLPGPRDLDPHCSCPDRGHPCKHAAALCYQTARLLDADPFVLLLLRGRGERELLDALSRLNATRAARAAREQAPAPLPGVRATDVLTRGQLPPLPAPLPVPAHPGQPPVYPAAPGGPDPFALDQLATDAAARAHALLTTGRDPVAELTLWQDAVRLAAARPGSGLTAGSRSLYASLASAADRTPGELARAVAAWRQGGIEGLAVLEEPWDPPAGRFDRARPLLLAADLPAFRPWRNHLTHPRGHVQLRLGRDGLWYAYESEPGHDDWWPRGTPDLDPVGALTGLGASPEG